MLYKWWIWKLQTEQGFVINMASSCTVCLCWFICLNDPYLSSSHLFHRVVHFFLGVAHEEPKAGLHLSCPLETWQPQIAKEEMSYNRAKDSQSSLTDTSLDLSLQWHAHCECASDIACGLGGPGADAEMKEGGSTVDWMSCVVHKITAWLRLEGTSGSHLVRPSCTKRVTWNRMLRATLTLTLRVLGKACSQLLASKPAPLQWKGFKLCRKESVISHGEVCGCLPLCRMWQRIWHMAGSVQQPLQMPCNL